MKRSSSLGLCLLTVCGKIKTIALLLALCSSDDRKYSSQWQEPLHIGREVCITHFSFLCVYLTYSIKEPDKVLDLSPWGWLLLTCVFPWMCTTPSGLLSITFRSNIVMFIVC